MRKQNGGEIRLRRLSVRNYKVLDSLDIEFPLPRMKGDPDIMILGSANGQGKTSVLESCAWLFLGAVWGQGGLSERFSNEVPVNFPDLLVRAGEKEAQIEGTFSASDEEKHLHLCIARSGDFRIEGDTEYFKKIMPCSEPVLGDLVFRCVPSLLGVDIEPLLLHPLVYFHSYRKLREGHIDLGSMVEGSRPYRWPGYDPGLRSCTFKREVLQAMMSRAELFEGHHGEEASGILDKLNGLTRHFAGGTLARLRPSQNSSIEFRVTPAEGGESFAFDGLSSGQKEIISTLFLIWRYSLAMPSIVLIDEPELHLNAEWHRSFIRQLHELAPRNQYIVATHSEDVFGSVPGDRRLMLKAPKEGLR